MKEHLDIVFGGVSTAGKKPENQDAFAAYQPTLKITRFKGVAACISDGVSAAERAQLASTTSVTNFVHDYYSTPDSWDVRTSVAKVLGSLNEWLFHHGQQPMARYNGLVCTFTGGVFKSNTLHYCHVGDSRLYRIRQHKLDQLTRDHTHYHGSKTAYLSRALGMDSRIEVDFGTDTLCEHDIYLFTSDGLHDFLPDSRLIEAFSGIAVKDLNQQQLESISQSLIDQALENGSDDNITILMAAIKQVPELNLDEAHRILTRRKIPPVLQSGEKIDEFTIENVLHSGTRSHVYTARRSTDNKLFVIKAPSINFEEDVVYLEGFAREQWVGSRLNDPKVMKILPPAVNSQFLYHVCEYVKGCTLRQWIDDNPQADLAVVRKILLQVTAAIRVFQRQRMVHRDIKPENIMVDDQSNVKLIDFGTVAVKGLQEITTPIDDNIPVGSVNYIAPEYVVHNIAEVESDLFSIAVIAYEMLAGHLPFDMEHVVRRGAKTINEWTYNSIRKTRPDIPLWFDLALKKACHCDMRRRYHVLSEFEQDLSKPNKELLSKYQHQPLLEKHSDRIWPIVSGILGLVVLLQWYWMVTY